MGQRINIGLATVIAAVLSGPAAAQSSRVDNGAGARIDWTELPSGEDYLRAFKFYGAARGVAIVACTLNGQRRPDDCEVIQQVDPRDGRFAVELAEAHRAEKLDDAGLPVVGRKVVFHSDFARAAGS